MTRHSITLEWPLGCFAAAKPRMANITLEIKRVENAAYLEPK
jgi:hypothetical protein